MIQRIQSVFLLASLCLLVPMFFVPAAKLTYESGYIIGFNFTGFYPVDIDTETTILNNKSYSIMAFSILICALNLIAIFLYRIRLLQIRFCIYNILFLIGLTGILFFYLNSVPDVQSVSYSLPIVFPLVSAILHYLAFRGIRKDHFMVEALSRLR